MSEYNVKNYTEQGGEVTHIGGQLVFDEGAGITGFPGAANLTPKTTDTIPPGTLRLTKRKAPKRLMARSPPSWGLTAPSAVGIAFVIPSAI